MWGIWVMQVDDIIHMLKLEKHPREGGYFRETYRSDRRIPGKQDDRRERSLSTAIYYLITPDSFSEIHRLNTDEIFHFYLGDPVEMLQLFPDGRGRIVRIGSDIHSGFLPQILVPRKTWQGCRMIPGGAFALMGTTMAPGFDFEDYESGIRDELIRQYPDFKSMIGFLTR